MLDRFQCRETRWQTPSYLLPELRLALGGRIRLDPCANVTNNIGAEDFYAPPQDGLLLPWSDQTFCNPPYGEQLHAWVRRVYIESLSGKRLLLLLSVARTEQAWFQQFVLQSSSALLFFQGRLPFNDGADTGMHASFLACYNISRSTINSALGHRGTVR